jgi:hypothetical protein
LCVLSFCFSPVKLARVKVISKGVIRLFYYENNLNRVSAYGRGTYFAKYASYSRNYSPPTNEEISFMLLCSVLVGNIKVYKSNCSISTNEHDNSVDNLENPQIHVTPYKYGGIPKYLVAFYRNAK